MRYWSQGRQSTDSLKERRILDVVYPYLYVLSIIENCNSRALDERDERA